MKIAIPVDENKHPLNVFGPAPYFLIFNTETNESYLIKNVYSCGGCSSGCEEGKNAADLLKENDVDVLLIGEISRPPLLKLLSKGITVYRLPKGIENIDKAIQSLKEGKTEIVYLSSV
ncbi:Predicted Fe-Mo cluster-binding protein, NifX family [Balnearium lithotrophicum]|uniref:Predicted Fe-Mo cluster-binding protein, NifX family n=1 Tax=Balnearium lithotrophicum TaxID=223788 RepID=A0A521BUS4_9BACT|nr:NifB/NifX family molybdenum-iron cluster-binding protein [Balnearium lithotrophicum]SMO50220.1 Predicted Fe-Mo cluster-binding protein, NifX family [Balnearium lithotrophicum]